MRRVDSFEKTLMLGKIESKRKGDNRGWDGGMASLTQWTWVWMGSGSWWWTGRPGVLRFMGSQRIGHDWATELNWSTNHAKNWLIGKDRDAGRDWGQEEKGTTEDEMAGWHHQLDGQEFGWTPGVGDGQGGLACCDSWGYIELDTTERLNWTTNYAKLSFHVYMLFVQLAFFIQSDDCLLLG